MSSERAQGSRACGAEPPTLPPGKVSIDLASSVSPAAGRRGTSKTRSAFTDPTTTSVGLFDAEHRMLNAPARCRLCHCCQWCRCWPQGRVGAGMMPGGG